MLYHNNHLSTRKALLCRPTTVITSLSGNLAWASKGFPRACRLCLFSTLETLSQPCPFWKLYCMASSAMFTHILRRRESGFSGYGLTSKHHTLLPASSPAAHPSTSTFLSVQAPPKGDGEPRLVQCIPWPSEQQVSGSCQCLWLCLFGERKKKWGLGLSMGGSEVMWSEWASLLQSPNVFLFFFF